MKIQQQFKIQGVPDPFTLLKVSQAFAEICCGEALELVSTGKTVPDTLLKVLPAGKYEVVMRDSYDNPTQYRIVVKKIDSVSRNSIPGDGCHHK